MKIHTMITATPHAQQGSVRLVGIVLVAIALVIGGLIISKERSRTAAKIEAARLEAVAQDKASQERAALEEQARKIQAAERDLLAQSLKKYDDMLVRWEDAERLAESSPRMNLAMPVAALQALRRETEQLPTPPCLATGKTELVAAMGASVDGYIAFMQNLASLGAKFASDHAAIAKRHFANYKTQRETCPRPV